MVNRIAEQRFEKWAKYIIAHLALGNRLIES